jgi:hypothetical protein
MRSIALGDGDLTVASDQQRAAKPIVGQFGHVPVEVFAQFTLDDVPGSHGRRRQQADVNQQRHEVQHVHPSDPLVLECAKRGRCH